MVVFWVSILGACDEPVAVCDLAFARSLVRCTTILIQEIGELQLLLRWRPPELIGLGPVAGSYCSFLFPLFFATTEVLTGMRFSWNMWKIGY